MEDVKITIFEGDRQLWSSITPLPIELGRQRDGDAPPYQVQNLKSHFRLAIAPTENLSLPRKAIWLEDSGNEAVRVINVHRALTFLFPDTNSQLPAGDNALITGKRSLMLTRDFRLSIETVESSATPEPVEEVHSSLRSMQRTQDFLPDDDDDVSLRDLFREEPTVNQGQLAIKMVKQALQVVQKAAGSNEFFDAAIRSTATMIDLDHAYVLVREHDQWIIRSAYSSELNETWNATEDDADRQLPIGSGQLLMKLMEDRSTVIFEPKSFSQTAGSSLLMLDRAVAAPMLDQNQNVIGALYGDRRIGSRATDEPIGDLEATLIEVMAAAVSSGFARQREEEARRREENLRSSMNQFFSPEVLECLQDDENLLSGREAEVTVLFCDIRGFSAISERVGPRQTIEWINSVLTELSKCVLETDGVLVDYIGDELMAMWGAPAEQPDHASRACQAALAMIRRIEPLRQEWSGITPEGFGVGIGINTGQASVGNTGSAIKFKYGPLGNTVNIASRVQGMTKQFGVVAMATQSTVESVNVKGGTNLIEFRNIADVRPVGVKSHLTVHQIAEDSGPEWCDLRNRYEAALAAFHSQKLSSAARDLITLLDTNPNDVPSVMLLQRVVDAIVDGEQSFDPVYQLVKK